METPGKEVHGSIFWRTMFVVFTLIFIGVIWASWTTIKGWFVGIGGLGNIFGSLSNDAAANVAGADLTKTPGYIANGWLGLTALNSNPNPFGANYTPTSNINVADPSYQQLYSSFQQNIFPSFWQGLNPGNWFTADATIVALFQQCPSLDTIYQINKDAMADGNPSIAVTLTGHLDQSGLDAIAAVIKSKS